MENNTIFTEKWKTRKKSEIARVIELRIYSFMLTIKQSCRLQSTVILAIVVLITDVLVTRTCIFEIRP